MGEDQPVKFMRQGKHQMEYPTGKSSEVCFSNHLALASD